MKQIKKIFISGKKGSGKTFLVLRLVEELKNKGKTINGYCTLMDKENQSGGKGYPVYIYSADTPVNERVKDENNLIGVAGGKAKNIYPEAFEKFAKQYLSDISESAVVIMDEVGFFESEINAFTEKIFEILESDRCVIIVLKEKYGNTYIDEVRKYAERDNAIFMTIREDSREELHEALSEIISEW